MANLERRQVRFPEGSVRAITVGARTYLFLGGEPLPVPTWTLKVPYLLKWLLKEHRAPRPSNTLGATVIPQMGCNAACGYCIQNTSVTHDRVVRVKPVWMADPTIGATAAFIEQQRQRRGVPYVGLTIFGGEPLLNPERCYRILERIQHVGSAVIVTNGTLLSLDVAQRLTELGVHNVQITFDGAQNEHDSIRVLAANGGGTYGTILQNLVAIDGTPFLPHRQLRIHVSRGNVDGLQSLLEDLASKLTPERWLVYFAIVDDNQVGWTGGVTPEAELDHRLAQLVRSAASMKFQTAIPSNSFHCGICSDGFGEGGIVVNADGQLSSCWDTAGFPDMVVGNVWSGYVSPTDNSHKWVQCGYRSDNQGVARDRTGNLTEHDWALCENAVQRLLSHR